MRRRLSKPYIFVLMLTLGLLISLQGKALQTGVKYVPLQELSYFKLVLDKEEAELDKLRQRIEENKERISNMADSDGSTVQIEKTLLDEIEELKGVIGIADVEGPGVIVIVTDGERDLLENEDPNNIIVHDADIRTIVDDLRYAGAEAISINGQRVIFNITDIYCNGPTIRVNNKVFSQPFIIRAIGNKKHLEASINAPGQYGNTLRQWGLFVEVNTQVYMKIDGYDNEVQHRYLKEFEEGES